MVRSVCPAAPCRGELPSHFNFLLLLCAPHGWPCFRCSFLSTSFSYSVCDSCPLYPGVIVDVICKTHEKSSLCSMFVFGELLDGREAGAASLTLLADRAGPARVGGEGTPSSQGCTGAGDRMVLHPRALSPSAVRSGSSAEASPGLPGRHSRVNPIHLSPISGPV